MKRFLDIGFPDTECRQLDRISITIEDEFGGVQFILCLHSAGAGQINAVLPLYQLRLLRDELDRALFLVEAERRIKEEVNRSAQTRETMQEYTAKLTEAAERSMTPLIVRFDELIKLGRLERERKAWKTRARARKARAAR